MDITFTSEWDAKRHGRAICRVSWRMRTKNFSEKQDRIALPVRTKLFQTRLGSSVSA